MKRRIKASINLSKIDKTLLFDGKKGKYLDFVAWIEDEPDQYGYTVSLKQDTNKEGVQTPYIGNGKHFGLDAAPADGHSKALGNGQSTDLPF